MGILSFGKRKSEKPNKGKYWMNDYGKIECPGDSCKMTCTDKCPIWLNTQGLESLMIGNTETAVAKLQKAVDIEPSFEGVYNNLGAAYGMIGEYEKSKEAYSKKLEFDPEDCDALFGLAVSHKNTGDYDMALKYCSKCEQAGGNKSQIEKIRKECKNSNDTTDKKGEWLDYLQVILSEESAAGHIDYRGGFPHIPEITMQGESAVEKIEQAMEADDNEVDIIVSYGPVWSAYAGMAMVEIWNSDHESFKTNGMVTDIIEARGIDEMDEYVYDLLGIPFAGNDIDPLRRELHAIVDRHQDWLSSEDDTKYVDYEQFLTLSLAMFNYGMIYQMARLGMH